MSYHDEDETVFGRFDKNSADDMDDMWLIVENTGAKTIIRDRSRTRIGRGGNQDVVIPDDGKRISREHLIISRQGNKIEIEVSGLNGAVINDEVYEKGERPSFSPPLKIEMGNIVLNIDTDLTVLHNYTRDTAPPRREFSHSEGREDRRMTIGGRDMIRRLGLGPVEPGNHSIRQIDRDTGFRPITVQAPRIPLKGRPRHPVRNLLIPRATHSDPGLRTYRLINQNIGKMPDGQNISQMIPVHFKTGHPRIPKLRWGVPAPTTLSARSLPKKDMCPSHRIAKITGSYGASAF